MTKSKANKLKSGDVVSWDDTDYSHCNRNYTIKSISVKNDFILLEDFDGDVLECYASELTQVT